MPSQAEKCQRLDDLHRGADAFIIPNPWDTGSAKILESLGFQALATTSSGFAFTLAQTDGAPSIEAKLGHCEQLADATNIPISVDFENGYAEAIDEVVGNVERLMRTGVAGCSIEDFSRDTKELYDRGHAFERIEAVAEAIAGTDLPFQLTARAENLLRGVTFLPGSTMDELAAHGARRISLGGSLTWASLRPVIDASKEMLGKGTFSFLSAAATGAEVRKLL